MVLTINDKGKKKYIKGWGKSFYLSRDKHRALNKIPSGYKLIRINGKLHLKKVS